MWFHELRSSRLSLRNMRRSHALARWAPCSKGVIGLLPMEQTDLRARSNALGKRETSRCQARRNPLLASLEGVGNSLCFVAVRFFPSQACMLYGPQLSCYCVLHRRRVMSLRPGTNVPILYYFSGVFLALRWVLSGLWGSEIGSRSLCAGSCIGLQCVDIKDIERESGMERFGSCFSRVVDVRDSPTRCWGKTPGGKANMSRLYQPLGSNITKRIVLLLLESGHQNNGCITLGGGIHHG